MLSQVVEGLPPVQYDAITFVGGMDQITSAYSITPGVLRECLNFSCLPNGGYARVAGYERFDGRPAPSDAEVIALDITINPGKSILVGDIGMFGNIFGTVATIDVNGHYLTLTKASATFSTYASFLPGPIVINGDTKGQALSVHSDMSLKEIAKARAGAANIYRADIEPVPGSGPIRGVAYYKETAFAWRDNVEGTQGCIYKSSPAGWVKVDLGWVVGFDSLNQQPSDIGGSESFTIQQTSNGYTAVCWRFVVEGDNTETPTLWAGRIIMSEVTGDFVDGPATVTSGPLTGATLNLLAPSQPITRLPGGNVECQIGNFSAYYDTERLYGADGVNDAFEFDGSVYVPIIVAGTSIKPKYAITHSNHLFLAMGSSIIHSAIGNPYNFNVISGAGEIGTGGLITGMLILSGSNDTATLEVTSRNSTWMLYGTSAADWKFVNFNAGVGALDRTLQNLFDAFSADDSGISTLKQSLNFGNFEAARLTHNIQRFVRDMRGQLACSSLSRGQAQYRLYYANGFGIYSTVTPEGLVGHGLVLFPDPVVCSFDGENNPDKPGNIFGTNDGYVMMNDKGTSFDGKKINAYMTTNINSAKTPRMRKRFRRLVLEVSGSAYFDLQLGYTFEWASPAITSHEFVSGAGLLSLMPYWDNMIWDSFFWDGKANDALEMELNGTGENVQLVVISEADYVASFVLHSAIFHYTPRRGNR